MVEQDAVAGVHPVALAVVDGDPVGVELGHPVRAARIEGGGLLLRGFLDQAVELTGAGLVDAGLVRQAQDAHCFKNAQGAQGVTVGGVLGRLKADRHVALGAQVVDLIGLHLLHDADQVGAVGQVAVVQHQARITLVGVLVQMIDPLGVEAAGPSLDAMHHIALLEQQLSQVATVLTGDACD